MSKRVNTKVWNLINNIAPNTPKNISWDEAWEKIANWGNIEGGVSISPSHHVTMDIYIDNQMVKSLDIENGYSEKETDCNWEEVFGQTIDYIFNEGLIKKPRARRKDAKKVKEMKPVVNRTKLAQISKITKEMKSNTDEEEIAQNTADFVKIDLDGLKKSLNRLGVRRNNYKKKGLDYSEIENEMLKIRAQIKDFKKN